MNNKCYYLSKYNSIQLEMAQLQIINQPAGNIWAMTCDFQLCGILACVDSDEPVQPTFKLRNSKWCSIAYAQAGLRLCWSHIPHCWKSHVAAHIYSSRGIFYLNLFCFLLQRLSIAISPKWEHGAIREKKEVKRFTVSSIRIYPYLYIWTKVVENILWLAPKSHIHLSGEFWAQVRSVL